LSERTGIMENTFKPNYWGNLINLTICFKLLFIYVNKYVLTTRQSDVAVVKKTIKNSNHSSNCSPLRHV